MPDFPKTHDYPFLGIPPHYGYRIVIWTINHLPEPLVYFMARRLADCRRLGDSYGRNAVMDNLRLVLGDDVPEKQISVAVGQGALAALAAYAYLVDRGVIARRPELEAEWA